ncbi:hypothetical protein [Actinosynnema sp. NPDC020468]|uniref:hypothetical protein n=1 Tax=Actinosynnema sp. NPDC020468 TaxID=3154488 RepID=UPI0034011214
MITAAGEAAVPRPRLPVVDPPSHSGTSPRSIGDHMPYRGARFAHVVVLVFSAVLAFALVRGLDEDVVLGHSALVRISDSDRSASGAQVARAIESFAAEQHIAVARELPDLNDPYHRRHLYLAVGDPASVAASWLTEGYPSFDRSRHTEVHPIAEVGQRDPRGYYYVFGPGQAGGALLSRFAELGLTGEVSRPLSVAGVIGSHQGGALWWSLVLIAVALIASTGAGVLLNTKAHGVARLHGRSSTWMPTRELRRLAPFRVIAVVTVAATAGTLLYALNGLAWWGLYAAAAGMISGALTLVVVTTHAVSTAVTSIRGLLPALAGELPIRPAITGAYLVRGPALVLALGIATNVASTGQDVSSRRESLAAYAAVGDSTAILLNGSLGRDPVDMEARVGQWLRRADADGRVIVAGRRELQWLTAGSDLPRGAVLVVNDAFLAAQPVVDPTGHRHNPVSRQGELRVIVPEGLSRHASTIAAAVPALLSPRDPGRIRPEEVTTLGSRSGQTVFSYNPGSQTPGAGARPGQDRSSVRDPVLVVVPSGSTYLTDNAYTAFATSGGIVFPDPDDVREGIRTNGLQDYVAALRPVGQNAAVELRDAVAGFRNQVVNLAMALAVLLMTGVGVCVVHTRTNAQAIFVKHLAGWRFLAVHRSLVAVEALFVGTLAVVGLSGTDEGTRGSALELGPAVALVAAEVGTVLVALAILHRRVVATRAAAG